MIQEEITLEALEAQPKDTYLLVDIRDEAAFQFGHMDGAIPKYAIQSFASKELQGIFGYVFMPTSVINLFSIFILRPIIGDLLSKWYY